MGTPHWLNGASSRTLPVTNEVDSETVLHVTRRSGRLQPFPPITLQDKFRAGVRGQFLTRKAEYYFYSCKKATPDCTTPATQIALAKISIFRKRFRLTEVMPRHSASGRLESGKYRTHLTLSASSAHNKSCLMSCWVSCPAFLTESALEASGAMRCFSPPQEPGP